MLHRFLFSFGTTQLSWQINEFLLKNLLGTFLYTGNSEELTHLVNKRNLLQLNDLTAFKRHLPKNNEHLQLSGVYIISPYNYHQPHALRRSSDMLRNWYRETMPMLHSSIVHANILVVTSGSRQFISPNQLNAVLMQPAVVIGNWIKSLVPFTL